jgi:hypothetical protein
MFGADEAVVRNCHRIIGRFARKSRIAERQWEAEASSRGKTPQRQDCNK